MHPLRPLLRLERKGRRDDGTNKTLLCASSSSHIRRSQASPSRVRRPQTFATERYEIRIWPTYTSQSSRSVVSWRSVRMSLGPTVQMSEPASTPRCEGAVDRAIVRQTRRGVTAVSNDLADGCGNAPGLHQAAAT